MLLDVCRGYSCINMLEHFICSLSCIQACLLIAPVIVKNNMLSNDKSPVKLDAKTIAARVNIGLDSLLHLACDYIPLLIRAAMSSQILCFKMQQ